MTLECNICGEILPTNTLGFVIHFKRKHPELPEIKKLEKKLEGLGK